jgi:hypothetical protein
LHVQRHAGQLQRLQLLRSFSLQRSLLLLGLVRPARQQAEGQQLLQCERRMRVRGGCRLLAAEISSQACRRSGWFDRTGMQPAALHGNR